MRIVRVFVLCLLPSLAAAQPVQLVHRFTSSPANPNGGLVQVPGGDFFGVTTSGVYRLTTAGQVTEVAHFDDQTPVGTLVLASDGRLFGMTTAPRPDDGTRGTIFRIDPITGVVETMHRFGARDTTGEPIGGLVAVGGSLYGVTRSLGGVQGAAIFHLVVATGQVVFEPLSGTLPTLGFASPLVLGPDGLLYGTSGGGIVGSLYRIDPATGVATTLREFAVPEGGSPTELALGADGSLYGGAARGGLEDAGTIFRYTPSTGLFQRLYSLAPSNGLDGRSPGPLVAGGDGHFYGVTDLPNNGSAGWTIFRLRSGAGGTFTYETLRVLDEDQAGTPDAVRLTLGADGLIYGYAHTAGPTLAGTDSAPDFNNPTLPTTTGTLFRFDPAEDGPPSNPIAFTVLHVFPLISTWRPSTPVLAADGFLYGLTSAGGAANRGAVYRLDATTGAVTILGDVPGTAAARALNSTLVPGVDGLLYGMSHTLAPSPIEHRVLRVSPASGLATSVAGPVPSADAPAELARTPAGAFYGAQRVLLPRSIVRVDPAAGTVTPVAVLAITASLSLSPVTALSDGRVVAIAQEMVPMGRFFITRTRLVRLNPAAASGYDETLLGDDISTYGVDRLVEGPGGNVYAALSQGPGPRIVRVDVATGLLTPVCEFPTRPLRLEHMSLGPDGALYGFAVRSTQRVFRCDPATGGVTLIALPRRIGTVTSPLAAAGGLLYGAATGSYDASGGVIFRLAAGGALPALDTDADGLPNTWETAYGLDPFGTRDGAGAAGDPDGDGRTNAEELAAGTHPRGFVTRLFAEGATGPFFRTRFDITAPTADGAIVRARFLTDTGAVVTTDLLLPSSGHLDLDPATVPGLSHASFSAVFESDATIAVDRTMTWGAGGYGSHVETAIAAASTTWYFAEGSTSGSFALFYLLQNPQPIAVTATVTYLRPSGQAPVVRTYPLPPNSRTTIVVDDDTAVASTDVSAAITATAPIVAERAMYLNRPGQPFGAGHESAGVTAPALDWFLAEGATGSFFDLFVLIANPNATAATVEVEYLRSSGGPLTKTYTVPAQSRMTIWVDDEELPAGSGQKPLAAANLSTVVRSTNAVPIIVERAMWWPGPDTTADFWYEAHNSPGVTGTALRWAIGGTEIGGSDGAESYVLIANTTSTNAVARVSLVGDDSVAYASFVNVPAKSRVTVSVRTISTSLNPPDGRYGVIVENDNPALPQVPFVVERATYSSPGGVFWASGANALATPIP